MSEGFKKAWTEPDVQDLIGQHESIRREFKSGVMFDRDPESGWVSNLSKAISALANTEGGELILGVAEEPKSRPRVVSRIDGVPTTIAPERLQQLLEGNVYPYLPGMRVLRVRLSPLPERVVFVIQVPQGTTAYQANDGRYYGRSEFEAKHLPDHEIRLRMSRGKVARATVRLRLRRVIFGAAKEAELRTKHAPAIDAIRTDAADAVRRFPELLELMEARCHPDEITFDLVLRNDSELTIRQPALELREERSQQLFDGWTVRGTSLPSRLEMRDEVIYPGDEREITGSECTLQCKRDAVLALRDYLVRWKVFLDNSPPSSGEIDVGSEIQPARDLRQV